MIKAEGVASVTFTDLDKMMDNSEQPQFNYETFNAAYQADDKLKNLIGDCDEEKVTFANVIAKGGRDASSVSKMAKRAVDLG